MSWQLCKIRGIKLGENSQLVNLNFCLVAAVFFVVWFFICNFAPSFHPMPSGARGWAIREHDIGKTLS